MLEEDLAPYYAPPLADEVQIGGTFLYGIYAQDDAEIFGAGGSRALLRVATADLPASVIGQTVTIGARSFKVRELRSLNTGAEAVLVLEQA